MLSHKRGAHPWYSTLVVVIVRQICFSRVEFWQVNLELCHFRLDSVTQSFVISHLFTIRVVTIGVLGVHSKGKWSEKVEGKQEKRAGNKGRKERRETSLPEINSWLQ